MHIAILPADTADAASARIRAYTLQAALNALGVTATRGYSDAADVLYIQKKLTPNILAQATAAKKRGAVLIYDIDDTGTALGDWAPIELFHALLPLLNVITTDTHGHRAQLLAQQQDNSHAPPIEIVPDAVDYFPQAPAHFQQIDALPLRVLWFGSLSNIGLFERYLDALSHLPDVKPVVATGSYGAYGLIGSAQAYLARYPNVEFVPWARATFIRTLQSCQLTCLMHDGADTDRAKSNNKFITSVTWGVPAAVSDTPEYARTARESGIDCAIFAVPDQLASVIAQLRSAPARAAYLAAAQQPIWERYAPSAVARRFLEVITNFCGQPTAVFTNAKTHYPEQAAARSVQTIAKEMIKEKMPYPIKQVLAPYIPALKRSLLLDPARPGARDYRQTWVKSAGRGYRLAAYKRQRSDGIKPLDANPSLAEIRTVLGRYTPRSVLEVGCGWGRLLNGLKTEFAIEGCDVSADMLKNCPPDVHTFELDIATEQWDFVRANAGHWDVLFVRGVMLYLIDNPLHTAYAMNNMLMLAAHKIVIWEWPEVCERMQLFSDSVKFDYQPIVHRDE